MVKCDYRISSRSSGPNMILPDTFPSQPHAGDTIENNVNGREVIFVITNVTDTTRERLIIHGYWERG